ncbi:MAG: hypothetical protein O3B64_01495 [bacterium]|nr:hypothetical protein [bacterium]MDA1024539.1 hypothetical protein [bacterium]
MNGGLNIPLKTKPRQQFAWRVLFIGTMGVISLFITLTAVHNLLFFPAFTAPEDSVLHWDIKLTRKHRRILETYSHVPLKAGSGRTLNDVLGENTRFQLHFDATGELIADSGEDTERIWQYKRRGLLFPFQFGAYISDEHHTTAALIIRNDGLFIREQGREAVFSKDHVSIPEEGQLLEKDAFILPIRAQARDQRIEEAVNVIGRMGLSTLESTFENHSVIELRSETPEITSVRIGDREIFTISAGTTTYYLHVAEEAFLTTIPNISSTFEYPHQAQCRGEAQPISIQSIWPLRTFTEIISTNQGTMYCFAPVDKF